MKWRQDSLDDIQQAQAEAAAKRRKLIERMRAREPKSVERDSSSNISPPTPTTSEPLNTPDIEAAISAARQLRFIPLDLEAGEPTSLNRPTLVLLEQFLEVLHARQSKVVLQWPFGQRDISLIHPLAMLATLYPQNLRTTGDWKWCEQARNFRTLYFPWRGGMTLASQRSLLVSRHELLSWNQYHLTRPTATSEPDPEVVGAFHRTLGHLNGLSKRDDTKPHLAHPTLAEIYPTFSAEGGETAPNPFQRAVDELLGRVRFGAALDKQKDDRPLLSDPEFAPFGFFGVSATAQARRSLAAQPLRANPPDICVLDLGPPALNRLGPNWLKVLEEFIDATRKRFPEMPFFAVTHDSFVHGRIARVLKAIKGAAKPASTALIRLSHDPLTEDPEIATLSEIQTQFAAVAGPTAEAVEALSDAARRTSDPWLAGTLRREMGSLRKAAALPCGIASAYQFLTDEIGQAAAEAFLESRSPATLLAPLNEALSSEIGGAERARVIKARDAVASAFEALDNETPIGSLLAELAPNIARKSSRSIIAFATEEDQRLGFHRLVNEPDAGSTIQRKLKIKHLRFAHRRSLDELLNSIESAADRNSWKRLVVVAPNLDWLSRLLVRTWLPDELIVVCERTFALSVAREYRRLASFGEVPGIDQLRKRLINVSQAAQTEAAARGVASVDLDLEPKTVIERPEGLIDLTDDEQEDGEGAVILSLASGRRLRSRPAATVVRYIQNAEANPFERASARDIRTRDTIVVPDQAFISEAREILPVQVLAASWVEAYHSLVEAHIPGIPGSTLAKKARHVLAEIQALGASTQSEGAVRDWLNIAEHKLVPPEERRPHAPQTRRTFMAFMSVIGVIGVESVAEKIWAEGIQPLRIDRRRAGQRMAQAFISVLVDPHGTASGFGDNVKARISVLRNKAQEYVDQVTDVQLIENEASNG